MDGGREHTSLLGTPQASQWDWGALGEEWVEAGQGTPNAMVRPLDGVMQVQGSRKL